MGIKRIFLFFFLVFFGLQVWAQQKFVRHTVQAGETVYSIAKKYGIQESELAKYNPDISTGLKEGSILIIPETSAKSQNVEVKDDQEYIYHTVQAKETLYGLSKQYNCTVEEIIEHNPDAKDGLKEGSVLKIPKRTKQMAEPVSTEDSTKFIYHIVEPKETVYSICKAAKITEEEFLELNPHVREKGLQIGQTVRLPKEQVRESVPTDQPQENKEFGLYRIQEGDDVVKIAAKYNTTVEIILELNPELKYGVTPGRYIVVPKKQKLVTTVPRSFNSKTLFWRIPKSSEKIDVHFAVMVPLYLMDNDSIELSTYEEESQIKVYEKSKIGLQFLAGLKVAMDTLSGLGYNIQLDIYDTKNDLNKVRSICGKIDRSVDAIIGPLYSANAELVAQLLPDVPVISPLSKTLNNKGKFNLINCIPDLWNEYSAMAHWINGKSEHDNIVFLNTSTADNHKAVKSINNYLFARDSLGYKEVWVDEKFSQLRELNNYLDLSKRNILVVVDQDAAFISDLLTKVNNRKDSAVFILATSKLMDIKTLETRYINNQHVVTMANFNVDYKDTATQHFIKDYRALTATEPNKFGFYGYDTGLYFAQLIGAYGKLPEINQWPEIRGVYKGFSFIQNSGYGPQNSFVYKLCIRNFELIEITQ